MTCKKSSSHQRTRLFYVSSSAEQGNPSQVKEEAGSRLEWHIEEEAGSRLE